MLTTIKGCGSMKLGAAAVLACLLAPIFPAQAGPTARLTGVVRAGAERAPVAGARVVAADRVTGRVTPSPVTAEGGAFTLPDLAPGSYEIAVQSGGGLFLVREPVQLAPGATRVVDITVGAPPAGAPAPNAADTPPATEDDSLKKGAAGLWDNPLTASLLVLGSAFLVGVLVENATDDSDEPLGSPNSPN